MTEVRLLDLLDVYVEPFDGEPADWDDVIRRTRRRRLRGRRLLVVGISVAGLLAVAPALGVLLGSRAPVLPGAADRKGLVAILDPRSRALVEVAPWKGHTGVCYLFVGLEAGCVPRSPHGGIGGTGTVFSRGSAHGTTEIWGFTFDQRAATLRLDLVRDGIHAGVQTVRLHRLGPPLDVSIIVPTRTRAEVSTSELYDRNGRLIG